MKTLNAMVILVIEYDENDRATQPPEQDVLLDLMSDLDTVEGMLIHHGHTNRYKIQQVLIDGKPYEGDV